MLFSLTLTLTLTPRSNKYCSRLFEVTCAHNSETGDNISETMQDENYGELKGCGMQSIV